MYHIVRVIITSIVIIYHSYRPLALNNNKSHKNSGDRYISRTVTAIEKKTSDLESMGLVTPHMKFLDRSKYIFC